MKNLHNPLLDFSDLPRFDAITAADCEEAVDELATWARAKLKDIENAHDASWQGILRPLELIENHLQRGLGPIGHLTNVKDSKDLRDAYAKIEPKIVALNLELAQSEPIYEGLCKLKSSSGWVRLSAAQRRIVEKRIQEAELSGAKLSAVEREDFTKISQEIAALSTSFSHNVLDDTKAFELIIDDTAIVDGMPQSFLELASQSYNASKKTSQSTALKGPWRIGLDAPFYIPMMQHCKNREIRQRLYRAYITRGAEKNEAVMRKILLLRRQKALMLGFDCYADMSLATKMAPNVATVKKTLQDLAVRCRKAAQEELIKIQEYAQKKGHTGPLQHWDLTFWSERLKEETLAFNEEDLRPYFPLPKVLEGVFSVVGVLFGVLFRKQKDHPKWDPNVEYYTICDLSEKPLAGFFLDPYSRPHEKRSGAWMDTVMSRMIGYNGAVQLPVAYIVCNGTPPVGNKPSLMSFSDVVTLFHEFGHALQHTLTNQEHFHCSGINGIEWDAIELPSQFMENWCYEAEMLPLIAEHYEKKTPLPPELMEKIRKKRCFLTGLQKLRQLHFSLVDMALHSDFDPEGTLSCHELNKKIYESCSVLPYDNEERFLASFSHIFAGAYAAGYYSYLWAEIMSCDAYEYFVETRAIKHRAFLTLGRKFRNTVLSQGGSAHPSEVYASFRGADPDPNALLRVYGLLSH